MATFIVCEFLCYLKKKYGSFDNRKLSSILHGYYDPAYVSASKDILVAEVEKLELTTNWPRPPRRRNSNTDVGIRAVKDIQDIMAIWDFLDSNDLIKRLPRFVAEDVDLIPTARLEDGDLRIIFNKLDKIEAASTNLMKTVGDWRTTAAHFSEPPRQLLPSNENSTGESIGGPGPGLVQTSSGSSIDPNSKSLVSSILDAIKSMHNPSGTSEDDEGTFEPARSKKRRRKRNQMPLTSVASLSVEIRVITVSPLHLLHLRSVMS